MLAGAPATLSSASHRDVVPLLALGALGLLMLAFVAAGPWIAKTYGPVVFVVSIFASGATTVAATALATTVPERAGLLVIFVLALAMRLAALTAEPLLSTDIYRYVWDGRVQAAGFNPYAYVPADSVLAGLRDSAIYPNINRANYAVTAYPPVAQMFFLAVTRIGETLTVMRLAMVACEIVVVAVMIDLLRRLQRPVTAVVAWAWHPLAIWEIANNGHVDALMVAVVMLGTWLLVRKRAVAGAVAVALAALIKPYALVILPAFWRPSIRRPFGWRSWDWQVPAAVLATVAICYLPYLGAGRGALGFLTSGYLAEEGFSSGEGLWLVALVRAAVGDVPGLTVAYMLVALVVIGWLAVRAMSRTEVSPDMTLKDIAALLMAALFFLSPNYDWYFLAVVPFIVLGGGAPAWAMSLGAVLLCRPTTPLLDDFGWKTLATLPFLIALAAAPMLRRRTFNGSHGAFPWTK